MKRLSSSDSLVSLMSICPNAAEEYQQGKNVMYEVVMEEEEEEAGHVSEKKRRLGVEQVKALEKNFEVEKKVEAERKVQLAEELGLQPRQVAVWFQNRRARWKTKQLERDYAALKSSYDALALDFDNLQRHNRSLLEEILDLKSRLHVEEKTVTETVDGKIDGGATVTGNLLRGKKEEGSSDDSDSSAIVNGGSPRQLPPTMNGADLELWEYEPPLAVKMEEHNCFGEESCSTLLFSDDQPPSMHWYCSAEWN